MNLFSLQNQEFIGRHIGPNEHDTRQMLATIGVADMEALIGRTVPSAIRMSKALNVPDGISEAEYLSI